MRLKEGILKIALLVAVIAIVVAASGCAQKEKAPAETQTPAAETKAAKEIVIGVTDKVTDLDPSNAYDFYTWEVMYNTMGGLMRYKPGTTELEPYLAESYEVLEDGKVYVFHLRKDLKFADGTPCTAHDVVRSIERVIRVFANSPLSQPL
jgi:peptide/nickel transport system substrate-binding protein